MAEPLHKTPIGTPYVFKTVDGKPLSLYVVDPPGWKSTDRRPAILLIHGGGWFGGKASAFNDQAQYLASRGMVCIQPEYRLLGKQDGQAPDICIQDAKSAMRWVRSHASELGIDPDRIAAGGGSAGGHLAAFLGMMDGLDDPQDDLSISARAQAMVLFNPVIDNGPGGYGNERVKDRYKEISPAYNVTKKSPPAVAFLGTRDQCIPVATLQNFQKAMQDAGVRCDVFLYEGATHGFFNRNRSEDYYYDTLKQTDIFLTSLGWLKGEPTLQKSLAPSKHAPDEAPE